jgi:hypothetical protein
LQPKRRPSKNLFCLKLKSLCKITIFDVITLIGPQLEVGFKNETHHNFCQIVKVISYLVCQSNVRILADDNHNHSNHVRGSHRIEACHHWHCSTSTILDKIDRILLPALQTIAAKGEQLE